MDKVILNGNKIRIYNQGNSQSGSIQFTESKLSIKGNSAGSGVLITDGKLHFKDNSTTGSIVYDDSEQKFKSNRPISSSQFIGDGSQLTNLPDTGAGIDIYNATSGSIPIWSDNQFLDDSPLSISQSKVSSSMPIWSQNIIYSNSSATSMAVGKMPAGVTFDKVSATEILHNILYYETPALGTPSFSGYDAGQYSTYLYLKLGETLNSITLSSTLTNAGSFNSSVTFLQNTTNIGTVGATSPAVISKSSYNKTYTTNTSIGYKTTATSTLGTTITSGIRYIRWREPIYSGYSTAATLTSLDDLSNNAANSGETLITATTPTCAGNVIINSPSNAFYYVVYDSSSANMLTGKDANNNADIMWLNNTGTGGNSAPCPPTTTLTATNEFGQLITYKVYRTYNLLSGQFSINLT